MLDTVSPWLISPRSRKPCTLPLETRQRSLSLNFTKLSELIIGEGSSSMVNKGFVVRRDVFVWVVFGRSLALEGAA
jgi:hypothetical protein